MKNTGRCELSVFILDEWEKVKTLPTKPTVCLFALEEMPLRGILEGMVYSAVSQGAMAFLTWRQPADELCETLDAIAQADRTLRDLLILPEAGESPQAVADFFVNSVYLDGDNYRCVLLHDTPTEQINQLIVELETIV